MKRKLLIALFALAGLSACSSREPTTEAELKVVLGKLFEGYSTTYAVHSEDKLKECVANNNQKCIEAHEGFLEAAKSLDEMDADSSLKMVMDVIEQSCLSEAMPRQESDSACFGGLASIYYYKTDAQDEYILSRIKQYPKDIQSMIFNVRFGWFYNRPNPDNWIDYLETADIDWRNQGRTIGDFRGNKNGLDEAKLWVFKKAFD